MKINGNDKTILRKLAEKQAETAELPAQKEKIALWTKLNELKKTRPLVWITELPWHEMNVDDELTLLCKDDFCRNIEKQLRMTIYQWKHLPADMIVENVFYSPLVINDSGLGINEDVEIVKTDESSSVVSREFHPQIKREADIEKIKFPEISLDTERTEKNFNTLNEIFGDILKVRKKGIGHQWFALWDNLIRWYGVENAMMDLILKPELVHAAMDRLLKAYLHKLKQQQQLNLLHLDNGNNRVGSGGPGYTDELPQKDFNPSHVRPIDQWGCANAQIFSEVSPEMHEEFALKYDRQWMKFFGLTYYGCCEPLHTKMDILSSIPNLRKISAAPKAKIDKMAEKSNGRYVLSIKPNPAIFAGDEWDPEQAEKEIRDALEKSKGCSVEIIMKDISTVRYQPQRLWDWADIAMRTAESFS
ncbi:MAG: hypothetical protein A2017_22025 [Lentisphaerae bacterium GWF2_44_16]|nr:MAG: hypothetical protein A2017_22025 [Lentisphaerae bacterium GWF2_44_16]